MARAWIEDVLTGQWGPDRMKLADFQDKFEYDVELVIRIGRTPLLQLFPPQVVK